MERKNQQFYKNIIELTKHHLCSIQHKPIDLSFDSTIDLTSQPHHINALTPTLFLTCSKIHLTLYENSYENTWTKKASIKCKGPIRDTLYFKRNKDMLIVAWKE